MAIMNNKLQPRRGTIWSHSRNSEYVQHNLSPNQSVIPRYEKNEMSRKFLHDCHQVLSQMCKNKVELRILKATTIHKIIYTQVPTKSQTSSELSIQRFLFWNIDHTLPDHITHTMVTCHISCNHILHQNRSKKPNICFWTWQTQQGCSVVQGHFTQDKYS